MVGRHIVWGREMLADGSLDNNGGFELAHNQTDIEIDLDVVDFSEYKSRYVYRLLGLEDEWMEVPADHKIRFSYIPSGQVYFAGESAARAESTGSAGISLLSRCFRLGGHHGGSVCSVCCWCCSMWAISGVH